MILIIAEPSDEAALWLYPRLEECTSGVVAIMTPTQLVCSRQIVHRLSDHGASSRFVLANGEAIESTALSGVVNRLGTAPTLQLARASPRDRQYAQDEVHAFLLGWLASLECPVVNRPDPTFLSGPWHSPLEALQLAALAGLPFASRCSAIDDMEQPFANHGPLRSHFVLDGQLVGPLVSFPMRDALLRFAALWGGRLLQIDCCVVAGETAFQNATSFVDFRAGGDLLVRALARSLRS